MKDLPALRERYLAAQLRGDRREALKVVVEDGLASGATVLELQEHVIQGAQREIGRLWQENVVSIAQEHMATAISNLALTQLFEHATPAPRNGKRILVACVEGEQHEFPARLVADALDLAGFDVRFIGANVPSESLLEMIAFDKPDLVALSATMSFHGPAMRAVIARIRHAHPGLRVAVGGGACIWLQGMTLDADASARTASELVEVARRVLEVRAA
jgi:MerR family transcriptional regulator, light-induced transcriptional regulator